MFNKSGNANRHRRKYVGCLDTILNLWSVWNRSRRNNKGTDEIGVFLQSTMSLWSLDLCLFLFGYRIHDSYQDATVEESAESSSESEAAEDRQVQDVANSPHDTDTEHPTGTSNPVAQTNKSTGDDNIGSLKEAGLEAVKATKSTPDILASNQDNVDCPREDSLRLTSDQRQRLWLLQEQADRMDLSPERKRASLQLIALKHSGDCTLIPLVKFDDEEDEHS